MRMLFISTVTKWGGSEFLWSLMAKVALDEGHAIEVVVSEQMRGEPEMIQLKKKGAIFHLRKSFGKINLISKLEFLVRKKIPRLFGYYKNINFSEIDLVVISQGGAYEACFDLDLFDRIVKFNTSYYLICQYHNEFGKLDSFLYKRARLIFPLARKIFFVSDRNRIICETFIGFSLSNAVVVNNPIRIKNNIPLPYPDSEIIFFACVARLDVNVKCQNLLLKVLSQEKWRNRKWQLNFFGAGPDLKYLKELTLNLKLGERVHFGGHVDDIQNLWANHHMLILPSAGEGCALSLIEAVACGRVAVVTDVGGHEKLIIDGKTGFLATSFSIKSLDASLETAWSMKDQWYTMGIEGFNHLKEVYDWEIEKKLVNQIVLLK
ncbi:MAG: glycosyltransferase [Bacteroidetes bacterium]|nr:glycosyltransferase [Bacteroidota bacterium]